MTSNLKGKFENLAAQQAHDPTKQTIEIPDPRSVLYAYEYLDPNSLLSSGWMHSGNSGGGHTGT